MSCCGSKRRKLPAQASASPNGAPHPMRAYAVPQITSGKVFEYTGQTALTVRGPITGRMYRFSKLNTRIAVDGRDASALMGVPNLRMASK